MKKIHLIILFCLLLAIITIIASIIYFKKENGNWEKVEIMQIKESFTVSGKIEALNESHVKAPLTGTLEKVLVTEGDNVSKGEVLAIYDKVSIQAELAALEAKLYQAKQNYEKYATGNRPQEIESAKADLNYNKTLLKQKKLAYEKLLNDKDRYTALYNKNMLTPKEYDDYLKNLEIAKVEYENQQNLIDSARSTYSLLQTGFRKEDIQKAKGTLEEVNARIEAQQDTINKATINSPISGEITSKLVYEGENVLTGDSLFEIFDKSAIKVKANIEEEDINFVSINDVVTIVPDAYPRTLLKGKVTSIYDKVDESTRLLPVKISITDMTKGLELLPGMTVNTTFEGHRTEHLAIPKKALQREGKKYYVQTRHGKIFLQVGKEHKGKVLVQGKITQEDEVLIK
jgi:RND family efflux transporter MFP subunit